MQRVGSTGETSLLTRTRTETAPPVVFHVRPFFFPQKKPKARKKKRVMRGKGKKKSEYRNGRPREEAYRGQKGPIIIVVVVVGV